MIGVGADVAQVWRRGRLCYFATPLSAFPVIIRRLGEVGAGEGLAW
jgi:hypothetical protein